MRIIREKLMNFYGFCKIGLIVAAVMTGGCSSIPKCSDSLTTNLIEDIFYKQFNVSPETKETMKKYLKFHILNARSNSIDEKINKNSCAGNLIINFDTQTLTKLADKFVFLENMDKFMGNVVLKASFNPDEYQSDIEYSVQKTENDGLYASVSGLDELIKKVDLLIKVGVFNNNKDVMLKKVIETDNSVLYYDLNSIVKNDGFVLIFSLVDYKQQEDQANSNVEVTKFYCNTADRYSIMNLQYYTEHLGEGNVVARKDEFNPSDIYALTPNTKQALLWEIACNRKAIFHQNNVTQTEQADTSSSTISK